VPTNNRVRWYFQGPICKPASDLLLCIKGKVYKEQHEQRDGFAAQTGRVPQGPIDLTDQPHVSAWASPAGFVFPQYWALVPAFGSWNPYYLTARILPGLTVDIVLARTSPGIPGGVGLAKITLIDNFRICLVIRLPEMGRDTGANWDGDADPPIFAIINNDPGNETEVALATGDVITVQIDILSEHMHNIYFSPGGDSSVEMKYISTIDNCPYGCDNDDVCVD
jgi:hypothetical protein